MISPKCNLCGDKEHEIVILYHINHFNVYFDIWCCCKCGLIFQWPQPEDTDSLYNEGYYSGANKYSYIDEREDKFLRDIESKRRIENLILFIRRRFKKSKMMKIRLLDVGCSLGGFVKIAKEMEIEAKGIDVSNFAVSTAQCNEINVTKQDVCEKVTGKYDAITMAEVIEHLPDPNKALQNCYKALYKDGILLIQTTNMDSIVRRIEGERSRYLLPGHIYYFSKRTLTKLLEKNNFKIEKIYYGHETGIIPALVRKSITNMGRYKFPDWLILIYTCIVHTFSKIRIGHFAIHNGMVVIARKVEA